MPQYFDSTAAFPMKTKKRVYASGGRVGLWHGGPHNTGQMNLLDESRRIRNEPQTRNVRAEEGRVLGELHRIRNRGYSKGGRVGLKKGGNGKWIQKATASIKKRGTEGKCTPITKPGCTGRAKALALTFKKMARKRKAS
jgi:hypothetical protein